MEVDKEQHKLEMYKKRLERNRIWRKNNRATINESYSLLYWTNESVRNRELFQQIIKRLLKQIKNNNFKESKNLHYVGCSVKEFKEYIESQFVDNMNWDNHNKVWRIEYIKKFKDTSPDKMSELIHYKNIRVIKK